MREILFRGKRLDNGEWVQGDLLQWANSTQIITKYCNNYARQYDYVDPATVCQYTGMTDQSGRKIFEGDLLKPFDDEFDKMVVEFHRGTFVLAIYGFLGAMMPYGWDETAGGYGVIECEPLNSYAPNVEVIGNIFDNPQPLRGGDCIG